MPGVVIQINIALAALGIAVAVLWPWSAHSFRPLPIEPGSAEFAAPATTAIVLVPQGWMLARGQGGAAVIRSTEPPALKWVIPGLLAAAVFAIFACPLQVPFWLLLAGLCGTWGYAIHAGPLDQSVTIHADGSIVLRGSARLAGLISREERIAASDVVAVLVRKARAEAHVVFLRGKARYGWRLHAASPADARAVAALVQSRLKRPAVPPVLPTPKP